MLAVRIKYVNKYNTAHLSNYRDTSGDIFHTYSAYGRGDELVDGTYGTRPAYSHDTPSLTASAPLIESVPRLSAIQWR
ncbi:hypothetical protein SAMN04487953_10521 [Billgrantia desiderata]|nr:hypothetical protein SAMN04487953_10521 [Halomonas desiderata]